MESTINAAAERIRAAGAGPARPARDPVNLPMIRNWLEAIGDRNPRYEQDGLAPPAMTQVWTMRGLHPAVEPADPLSAMSAVLDQAGFTSVVATNCEQTYHRYLRDGERVEVRSRLVDVSGPKRTALGEGWFVTTDSTWYVGAEAVASMTFRVLKFRPSGSAAAPPTSERASAPVSGPASAATSERVSAPVSGPASAASDRDPDPASDVLRPVVTRDTAFFWTGTAAGELRIQRCGGCGQLRHPPGPVCRQCGADRKDHLVARGTGEVFSFVVHHHPPVPGRRLPIVVALVELTEGVRMVGEVLGVDPAQVRIGAAVQVDFVRVDAELTLPAWRLLS
ncbi:bifunctional MaoC family dehydratase N-terminal/OB-fold nucleic acid binding domain-containing protein [Salinispora cortesiana]|uniref:bifunctional MaoC family dehydratase N-terminal/OB-fold nucleic acid binding domain-containing protein n=1 Tax=Salinispora cortesiana TaxID=1305843 RepID=UPI0003F88FE9|nr:OB-fold domain-containing protein [Salinispora cortesiana]